ncbi:MAG: ankyrin repeat domain-containing protein [Alphaproteobacteria bacterium]|nr:ankyrin repeat domain-containing protein [Alphaproteobacteria bacterium]
MQLSDYLEKEFETGAYNITEWESDPKRKMTSRKELVCQIKVASFFVAGGVGVLKRKMLGPWCFVLKRMIDKGDLNGVLDVLDVYQLRNAVQEMKQGNEKEAFLYLEKEPHFFSKKEKLQIFMNEACKVGHLDLVQKLYEAGARLKPSFFEDKVTAPMIQAAMNGKKEIVEFLLKEGVSHSFLNKHLKKEFQKVSHEDLEAQTVLILSDGAFFKEKKIEQEEKLIQKMQEDAYLGRFPEVIDLLKKNPLISVYEKAVASLNRYIMRFDSLMVRTLLDLGVSLVLEDQFGQTPLEAVIQSNDRNFLKFFQDKGLLHQLVANGKKGLLLKLIQEQESFWAGLLIRHECGLQEKGENGETPLMMAAFQNDMDVCGELFVKKVSLKEEDFEGRTALFYALRRFNSSSPVFSKRKKSCLEVLVDKGVHLDHQDKNGETPLMMAIRGYYHDAVDFLLENQADLFVKNKEGLDAYNIAMQVGNTKAGQKIKAVLRQKIIEKRQVAQLVTKGKISSGLTAFQHQNGN